MGRGDRHETVSGAAGPVGAGGRVRSLDVLRGAAVLGIFAMNIRNFALPIRQFDNPAFPAGPATGADLWVWGATNLVLEDKMIAIFSLLFGAGIVVMAGRVEERAEGGRSAGWLHYRRMLWLLVIGLLHAFGVWYGDILTTYAVCGAIIFPMRRLKPALLVGIGVVVLTGAVWFRLGPAVGATLATPPAATAAQPSAPESYADRIWRESFEGEKAACEGGWWGLVKWRARLNIVWNGYGGVEQNWWRCGGFMLIGMGLVQLGVVSATRGCSVYWGMVLAGYGLGAVLAWAGFWPQLARALGRAPEMSGGARQMAWAVAWTVRYAGAAAIAAGHVGAVMLLCRAVAGSRLLTPLASAGRMALSNYLLQSLIAAAIFDGWAGGQWGRWRMWEMYVLVGAVWAGQLVLSPVWLRYFEFGPVEWVWRSLTYGRAQGMRRGANLRGGGA